MESNLISIIIPIYNTEKTIRKCLESVINQTYTNIEIILIDDGSDDNSYNICKEYQKKDTRITLIRQDNSGVSKARNVGLDVAKGKYIGFVDSDDYIDHNMYELMIKEMEMKQCKLCVCNYYFEDKHGKQIRYFSNQSIEFLSSKLPENMFNNLSINGFLCNKLYDRNLIYIKNKHINMNEKITMLEDNLFNYSIYDVNTAFKCSYISNKLYHYVQYSNSACNTKYDYNNLQYFTVRDEQIKILERKNLTSNYLKADYVINFSKAKIKFKILKLKKNNLYRVIEKNAKEYKKQVKINELNSITKIKYILCTRFMLMYWLYIYLKKENI